jgi:hypothetical protein
MVVDERKDGKVFLVRLAAGSSKLKTRLPRYDG